MSRTAGNQQATRFPTGPLVAGVAVVCVGLLLTAAFTFQTMGDLRREYLEGIAHDLALFVDSLTRGGGPARRLDPEVGRDALEQALAAWGDSVASVRWLDANGAIVAAVGEVRPNSETVEVPLARPRQGQRGRGLMHIPGTTGAVLEVGFRPTAGTFITRAATTQAVVAAVASLTLAIVAVTFVRTARRFVALQAKEEAQRRLTYLGSMAATLAHEIRNPLGAMKGLTQVAQERLPRDHDLQDLMTTVVGEAQRLERLVADLLQFARPRTTDAAWVDVVAAVSRLRSLVEARLAAARATLRVEGVPNRLCFPTDPDGLDQVLLNIVLNGIEASPAGAEVRLCLEAPSAAATSDDLSIIVEDEGPGLEGRDPEDLFRPFATTKLRGSGLGLAVSRQIVEGLGGTIELVDRPAGGARCMVRLPPAGVREGPRDAASEQKE